TYEDTALSFRTALAGGTFTFIDAPLIRYRRHGGNITFDLRKKWARHSETSFDQFQSKRRCELERFVELYRSFILDADRARSQDLLTPDQHLNLSRQVRREGRRMELKRDLLQKSWLARWRIFLRLYGSSVRPRECLGHLPLLLPTGLHRFGFTMLNRAGQ
ncbi:MAG TPA: hypothetical protein VN673_17510, partial [Clostridia bacterium]|nr:hypothetical protein [Clostridia bacterium]